MTSSKLVEFSPLLAAKIQDLRTTLENHYTQKLVTYVLNSDYRKAVDLKSWIKNQVIAGPEVALCDDVVINYLKLVVSTIDYIPDQVEWRMPEYWQTADETTKLKSGDCEDGAILLYHLLRLNGVPANRLLLMAGDVVGGGHCWLAYRPDDYPLNWVFLDWCYYSTTAAIGNRNFFYVEDQLIYEITSTGKDTASKYDRIWFAFNEDISYVSLTLKW